VRIDGRLRKIYLGKGEAAEANAARVVYAREERQYCHEARRSELAQLAAVEERLRELQALADVLMRTAILGAGRHEHRSPVAAAVRNGGRHDAGSFERGI
jgi:hypothetical protein